MHCLGCGLRSEGRWLLLRQAMHGAESPDQVAGINGDDLSRFENRRQRVKGNAIVGIIEDRRQHNAIGNVKVGITRRQASLLEEDRSGHRHLDNV